MVAAFERSEATSDVVGAAMTHAAAREGAH